MVLDSKAFNHNVSELKNLPEKNYLIDILKTRLEESKELLEDPLNSEVNTGLIRGGVIQIRDLIELFS